MRSDTHVLVVPNWHLKDEPKPLHTSILLIDNGWYLNIPWYKASNHVIPITILHKMVSYNENISMIT